MFEPYNPYSRKPRKKHWMEIAEEEELYHRMMLEARAKEFIDAAAQHAASAQAAAVGAGGVPPWSFFQNKFEASSFTISPNPSIAPATITFTNLTPSPDADTFFWEFGSGSLTSALASPGPVLYLNTGSFTIILHHTSSAGAGTIYSQSLTLTAPTLTAGFTFTSSSLCGPTTVSFVNTSTNTSQTPTSSYFWQFGDGTTSSLATPPAHGYHTGSYTASLQHTGSYSTAVYTQSFEIAVPTLAVTFVVTPRGGTAPLTTSYTVSHTYNGNGTVLGTIRFGDGTNPAAYAPGFSSSYYTYTGAHYYETGSHTASVSVTESTYNIATKATPDMNISASVPVLGPDFVVTSASIYGPYSAAFQNTSTNSIANNDSINYRWIFDDGTSAVTYNAAKLYHTGSYGVRLEVSESKYRLTASKEMVGGITASVPTSSVSFTVTTESMYGPASASFYNTTTNNYGPYDSVTYTWVFVDQSRGSVITSTDINPPTLSLHTGSYTASLQVTESIYSLTFTSSAYEYTLAVPVVNPGFGLVTGSNVAPLSASFTNTSVILAGPHDAYSYLWVYGDGSTETAAISPTHSYNTGSFPVRLELSESVYRIYTASIWVGGITGSAPTITGSFTTDVSPSGSAPLNVTFSAALTWVSSSTNPGRLTYFWNLGSGSMTSTDVNPTMSYLSGSGPFSVTLAVTESIYNIGYQFVSSSVIEVGP